MLFLLITRLSRSWDDVCSERLEMLSLLPIEMSQEFPEEAQSTEGGMDQSVP
jgi:hypothetical protein